MIPALGIAIYNRPDLLLRCLASLDQPVGLLVIVNNGRLNLLEDVQRVAGHRCREIRIVLPEANLGCAGGWNVILKKVFVERTDLDYVLICGNDIEWQPGDLEVFATTVRQHPDVDFIAGNHSYSNYVMKRSCWLRVGAFDENIELAYCEDNDHWQRIMRTPGVKAIHVAGLKTKHEGSSTIKSDPDIARRSAGQHATNLKFYYQKWGCTAGIGTEKGEFPFEQADQQVRPTQGRDALPRVHPVNEWHLTGDRLNRPHCFTRNPIFESPVIFTHCGKLGDMLYALPIAEWFWRTHGRKVHWVLPRSFEPFRFITNLLCFQPHCAGVTLVDHPIENFGCGGQPYRFDPRPLLGRADLPVGQADQQVRPTEYYNLGFRHGPDKFITKFYAEEHGFGYVPDYRLSLATSYAPHYAPMVKTEEVLRTREDLMPKLAPAGAVALPATEDLLTLARRMANAKEFHTWYCGLAVLAWFAGIPQHVYRAPGHAAKELYFPEDSNITWYEVTL